MTFVGALLYVRRLLPPGGARHTALLLVLFAVMPASALVAWTDWGGKPRQYTFDFISGEMWTGQYLWGYLMTAHRGLPDAARAARRRALARDAAARARSCLRRAGALLVCWLQPWQGGTLALIVLAVEALRWWRAGERPGARRARRAGGGRRCPRVYYFVLSVLDPAWELASESNAAGSQATWSWPWWAIVLTLAPLAVPAALAYRTPARDWQAVALRVWPFAALVVYLQPAGTFPYHSFQGLAIPLSILAVQGVLSVWPRPRAVAGRGGALR